MKVVLQRDCKSRVSAMSVRFAPGPLGYSTMGLHLALNQTRGGSIPPTPSIETWNHNRVRLSW